MILCPNCNKAYQWNWEQDYLEGANHVVADVPGIGQIDVYTCVDPECRSIVGVYSESESGASAYFAETMDEPDM
jgi:hypothetical protein